MGALTCGQIDTYADDIAGLRTLLPAIAEEVAGFTGVAQVVDWLVSRLGKPTLDMVAMDEFEYDFLIELEPTGRWLVFGVT